MYYALIVIASSTFLEVGSSTLSAIKHYDNARVFEQGVYIVYATVYSFEPCKTLDIFVYCRPDFESFERRKQLPWSLSSDQMGEGVFRRTG